MKHLYLVIITIHLLLVLNSCYFSLQANTADTDNDDLSALLFFRSQIISDPHGAMASWNSSLHHCQWPGVGCGRRHPDRVTSLVLDSVQLAGHISPSLANLTFLQRLSLTGNQLSGSIPQELGHLNRLRFLNLSMNSLDGTIPSTLANCSSLQVLSLGNNNLTGTIPSNIGQLKHLMYLNFRSNLLSGAIPQNLGRLSNLAYLSLSSNNLSGFIPHALGNLTSLINLYLEKNSFTGSIPSSLGRLRFLQFFYLFANNISGDIPRSIFNLSAIVKLEIDTNQLTGVLPLTMCDSLPKIQNLFIFENKLSGPIPASISNCSALSEIDFGSNNFKGPIPSSIGTLKNLNVINLGQNHLEAITPKDWSFLDALSNCTQLQAFDLGSNQLQGHMPSSIGNLSTNLYYLGLYMNQISGTIPYGIGKLTNLNKLVLMHTLLSGTIPKEIGNLGKLQYLSLSTNKMSGTIPSAFGNLTAMIELYLYGNEFEGSIPAELSNMQALQLLDLSNNKLTGNIPEELTNISSLSIGIDLSNNYLNGSIPLSIGKWTNLGIIYFSNNNLSGEIPRTIDGCQILQALFLDSNSLHGTIPSTVGKMKGLQGLNLANNFLSGQLPQFLERMDLEYLNISFNNFEGELPRNGIFKEIDNTDIRGNPKLCGGVPKFHLPKCVSDSDTDTPVKRHHSNKTIAIIVSSVSFCMICFMAIACFLASCYLRKRLQNEPEAVLTRKSQFKQVSYNEIFRATDGFSMENRIGRGAFGVVYKADMSFENVKTVAVKVLNLEQHGASRSFLAECEALRNVRHRNLIKVLGLCSGIDNQGNDFKALVFEFMQNGSLEAWLHPNACTDRPFASLNLLQRLSIAIDVAEALDYLHCHGSAPIVHCDLKPSNVLLDDGMTAHVGDFGLAKILVRYDAIPLQSVASASGIKGSVGYIAPEYGLGGQPSVEGDVYSYGILLLEMFTGVSPIDEIFKDGRSLHEHVDMAFPDHIMDVIDDKLFSDNGQVRMSVYKNVDDCLVSVLRCGLLCSEVVPKERIVIKEAIKELKLTREKLSR